MTSETTREIAVTLEIRHQIGMKPDGSFFVREIFGEQSPSEWPVPDRPTADALVKERRDILTRMVADISDDAAEAVRNARYIDNIRSGSA